VLLNLLINASQAMPEGGHITVSCHTEAGANGHQIACIDVSDTGGGIDPAIRDLIFESFLSGRPDGTGLGLAIAKRILLSHHGDIQVVRSDATGTTLRITLPVAKP